MTHLLTNSPARQAEQSRRKRQPFSELHDLVPPDWEEPLLIKVDPDWGVHDLVERSVGINFDQIDWGVEVIGVDGMWGYFASSFASLCFSSDDHGIVLNPGDCLDHNFGNMPRKRIRSLLWALSRMGAIH